MPQEFLRHAISDYLVRGTDLFSLRLSNKKMTIANTTIAVHCKWIKIIPIIPIFVRSAKSYFLQCHRILVISLCVPWDEKVENQWHRGIEFEPKDNMKSHALYASSIHNLSCKGIFFFSFYLGELHVLSLRAEIVSDGPRDLPWGTVGRQSILNQLMNRWMNGCSEISSPFYSSKPWRKEAGEIRLEIQLQPLAGEEPSRGFSKRNSLWWHCPLVSPRYSRALRRTSGFRSGGDNAVTKRSLPSLPVSTLIRNKGKLEELGASIPFPTSPWASSSYGFSLLPVIYCWYQRGCFLSNWLPLWSSAR